MTTMSRKRTRSYSEDHKMIDAVEKYRLEAPRMMVSLSLFISV